MAIATTMSTNSEDRRDGKIEDGHEYDLVMPGFRFHPTEEELIEFYLRRKVEGKRFNVELITFLDLYRYDPWELPALATIGEKEWFFYVPRDRKYRNGDRPNRVTTSGYWKATGADRMIRSENSRPIGLKKTLVFYSGKAPRGIRSSWIMNEYRLPQNETDRYHKEISLCRVYKRPSIEDHSHLPGSLCVKPSSSNVTPTTSDQKHKSLAEDSSSPDVDKIQERSIVYNTMTVNPMSVMEEEVVPQITRCNAIAELSGMAGYNQSGFLNDQPQPQPQLLPINVLPDPFLGISDKLWDWSSLPEDGRDYGGNSSK
ncbi:uncharacterized protein A4U43_C02F5460 [Asparagus officinalis]|uniref:NAC domain-containing protein n=1 Tax=Asparagus officinalis TaxID=4686 RepID=A0A5P1FGX7_ASPOF|nr:NAC domain-containing protein 35-like [Asparagus officinalis]ONK77334.1 uncharacterized protein A4U43_C02F5460 [Asparagus officinalis]